MPVTRPLGRSLFALLVSFLISGVAGAGVTTIASPDGVSDTPGDVVVDDEGNIYSADFGGTTVVKIAPDGTVSEFLNGLDFPSGHAFDTRGNFYQANYGDPALPEPSDTIIRRSPKGKVTTWAKGLEGPVGIAVAPDNVLFVAMCDLNNVTRIPSKNEVEIFVESDLFNCPNGIAFGETDDLYVVNFDDGKVLEIKPDRSVVELARVPGDGNGHVIYVAGDLYVTSGVNHQIWKVNVTNGKVALVAGNGNPGQVDGPNLEAEFYEPNGIDRNREGSLLFTNGLDGVVRQIALKLARPKPPRNTKAEVLSASRIRISWKHNSLNREGFSIHLAGEDGDFSKIDMVGPRERSAVIDDLDPATTYQVKVRTFNGTKKSKFSIIVDFITQ